MEFAEVVRKRKMIRNYLATPVDPDALERILDAAVRAPSAGHSQGQYLVVVTDADTRKAIAELGNEAHYVASGMPPWMSTAPVHLVICVREDDYHDRYREPDKLRDDGTEIDWPVPYWWVDAGAMLMLVLLATVNEGLSAGLFGSHRLEGCALSPSGTRRRQRQQARRNEAASLEKKSCIASAGRNAPPLCEGAGVRPIGRTDLIRCRERGLRQDPAG